MVRPTASQNEAERRRVSGDSVPIPRDEDIWKVAGDPEKGLKGPELIQAYVKLLPNGPGVYRMLNESGDVLYVGKARSLKKRVSNYAQGRGHTSRIESMIRLTAQMEFRLDPYGDRGAAPGSQPDQEAAAALQCADAR